MKKIRILLSFSMMLLLLAACKPSGSEQSSTPPSQSETSNDEELDPFFKHKKVLKSITEFDVTTTSGFDYVLEQKVDNITTNSREINLRINRKNELKARRDEKVITLNDKVAGEQFTITEETIYYHIDQIGTFENGSWNWSAGEFNNFIAVNIGNFTFDITKMTNVTLNEVLGNEELVFTVPSTQIMNVFGDRYYFTDVTFTILFNPSLKELIKLNLSYRQQLSATTFNFEPVYGDVTVILPS